MVDDKLNLSHFWFPSVIEKPRLKFDQLLEMAQVELSLGMTMNNVHNVCKSRILILDKYTSQGNINCELEFVK